MKINNRTINYLTDILTGDSGKTKYLKGSELVNFFNGLGYNDKYEQGFPARKDFAKQKIKELNDNGKIKDLIESYYNPISFIGEEETLNNLLADLNKYLYFDDLKIKISGKKCIIISIKNIVQSKELKKIDHEFIEENINKVSKKISEGDYSGAITNARSLVETVLIYIRSELKGEREKFNGELHPLYSEVAKKLNLTSEKRGKEHKALKRFISGLFSIISGIAELSNDLGDRHGKALNKFQSEKHHAILVANAAKALCEFLFCCFESQKEMKKI